MNKVLINTFCVVFLFVSLPAIPAGLLIYEGKREIQLSENFKISKCNNISFASCPTCLDTPSYYFKSETMQIISSCGGACWHPRGDQVRICKTLCPPPEWSCGKLVHSNPLHDSEVVIEEFFDQSKINRAEVKVIKFEFDYIKGVWRIELQPLKSQCKDCYLSFYFKNAKELVLQSVKHG